MIPGKYPVISTVLRMQIFFLKLLMNIGKRLDFREKRSITAEKRNKRSDFEAENGRCICRVPAKKCRRLIR